MPGSLDEFVDEGLLDGGPGFALFGAWSGADLRVGGVG